MAVIINELEVVVDAPKQQLMGPAPVSSSDQMKPLDVTDVMDQHQRYELRTLAH